MRRALPLVLGLLLVPVASAGLSADARPFVGYVGVVQPGETFQGGHDVVEQLGLDVCGGDAIGYWRVRVTALGLVPMEELVVVGNGYGDVATLTYDAPSGVVRSVSPTTCMAGALLDARGLLAPVAFTITAEEEL